MSDSYSEEKREEKSMIDEGMRNPEEIILIIFNCGLIVLLFAIMMIDFVQTFETLKIWAPQFVRSLFSKQFPAWIIIE